MTKFNLLPFIVTVITWLSLTGCQSQVALVVTATPTTSATQPPQPTVTITHTPTSSSEEFSTLTPTITPTPFPTKKLLLLYDIMPGDGGFTNYFYMDYGTPKLALYNDGQLLIQATDSQRIWFQETTLTPADICSLYSQIEKTDFFTIQINERIEKEKSPIYKFEKTTDLGSGAGYYVIQVNGTKHNQIQIYPPYLPYLIPKMKQVFDLIDTYTSTNTLTDYQAQFNLLWIEKTTHGVSQTWPSDLPSLKSMFEADTLEGIAYLEWQFSPKVQQVLVKEKYQQPLHQLFGRGFMEKWFKEGNQSYYVVERPLLPHETPDNFIYTPPEDDTVEWPAECHD